LVTRASALQKRWPGKTANPVCESGNCTQTGFRLTALAALGIIAMEGGRAQMST